MKLSGFSSTKKRRRFLETKLKIRLENIAKAHIEEEEKIHCENLIGETTLPLAVAGPIKIKNLKLKTKSYYLPLATTEGALVASVNRGCKAINLSGGATVVVETIGATRGPVFETEGIEESFRFKNWLDDNFPRLQKQIKKTSSHTKLTKYETAIFGHYVFLRFYFDTDKAMGMNMATLATESITNFIQKETGIKCLSISGNFCVDKKPSRLNFLLGRGKKVWAETILKKPVIKKVLKTTAKGLYQVWLSKCLLGSSLSGSIGFNGHFANMVAAFFAATGQDLAHVVEGSLGVTTMRILPKDSLYFSIYLPDLMIGMVGGGMKLKIKQEALAIIQAKTAEELAAVLAGAVLAGEVSLLASLAEGTLARAHKKLGR